MGANDSSRDSDPNDDVQPLAENGPREDAAGADASQESRFVPDGWEPVSTSIARGLESEAHLEFPPDHQLFGRELTAVSRCPGCDDVLFRLDDGSFAIVHLTWIGKQDQSPWPAAWLLDNFSDVESCVAEDLH